MKTVVGVDLGRPEGDETVMTVANVRENGGFTIIDDWGPAPSPELMERVWEQYMHGPAPDLFRVSRGFMKASRPHGSRFVLLSDDKATDLGIQHLARERRLDSYFGYYDRRRVKRARRMAVRHGFTRHGTI